MEDIDEDCGSCFGGNKRLFLFRLLLWTGVVADDPDDKEDDAEDDSVTRLLFFIRSRSLLDEATIVLRGYRLWRLTDW